MLYGCTHMATVGVKVLRPKSLKTQTRLVIERLTRHSPTHCVVAQNIAYHDLSQATNVVKFEVSCDGLYVLVVSHDS